MLQVAATELGSPRDATPSARTDKVPTTAATAASSGERLGVDPSTVRFVDGRVLSASGAQLTWAEVVRLVRWI